MLDDSALLQRFAANRGEDDFAELVRRHLNLVYSAALRQVRGDHHFAEEIAQTVFADLARKAGSMTDHSSLAGWLYTSAHYAAAKVVRGEQRRRTRETEAGQMQQAHLNSAIEVDWERLQPVIDEAMHVLPEADRDVILQRYFERKPFLQIGVRLGLNENAARMRAERALDKLRGILAARGVSATTVALAAVLTAQSVLAAPAELAGAVVSTSLVAASKGAAVSGGLMGAAKLKVLIPSACAVALLVGVVWQELALNRLREQNATLRGAQMATVGDTSEAGPNPTAETEGQQREKLELMRLRGEVGRLQRELKEQRALAAKLAETNSITAQAATKVDPQINVRALFFSGTDEALESFSDNSTDVVAPQEMTRILKHLKQSGEVEFLTQQEVTTLSGRQAQVNTLESRTNVSTGAVTESGYTVDVIPKVQEDGQSVALALFANKVRPIATYAMNGMPLPQKDVMTANTVVQDGQTVALTKRYEGRKVVILVTPTLIDSAGNRVHPETEL